MIDIYNIYVTINYSRFRDTSGTGEFGTVLPDSEWLAAMGLWGGGEGGGGFSPPKPIK